MAIGDVLVIGSGGREHAFVWKLRKSPFVQKIYVAPGNAGIEYIAENIPIQAIDINNLLRFALEKKIDLTIVGPELPLKLGIVDLFRQYGLCIFGPTSAASRIEISKAFTKQLLLDHQIPTAPFRVFTSYKEANKYIHEREFPLFIKADGLAGGKGANKCENREQAEIVLKKMMIDRIYGDSGDTIVIEDCLQGYEASIHALCSENTVDTLLSVQDHKALENDNKGPNTGGMGAYAPIPTMENSHLFHVEQMIIKPILRALKRNRTPFAGCLYPGLMITADGPNVLEINARFGDPETQVLMALLANDLFLVLKSYACGESEIAPVFLKNKHAVCVVLCSKGYPSFECESVPIHGIQQAQALSGNIIIFHGATKRIGEQLYINGGRILSVTAIGDSIEEANDLAYRAIAPVGPIYFEGMHYRTDITKSASQ